MLRRFSCALVLLCALLVPALGATAQATSVPYVALGDSFSGGEGNRPFDGKCHRAEGDDSAYPRILPSLVGYVAEPSFNACTGATIADVWQRPQPKRGDQKIQLEYLSPATRLVTLTIGGNDIGFAEIVTKCLFRRDCTEGSLAERVRERLATIRARLTGAYRLIREHMDPGGYLLVAGYPRLFLPGPDAGCEKLISRKEAEWIDSLVIQGNARIAKAVADATASAGNVAYVDVTERFAGHELCSNDEWLHDLHFSLREGLNPFKGSYHPNKNGQRAYAEAFAGTLRRPAIRAALTAP